MTCYLGLGSNLGDRPANLQEALRRLAQHPEIEVIKTSSFYETDPVGPQDQPDFLNQVAEIHVTCSARELLGILQNIESQMERIRTRRWGPRNIDMDILLYGHEQIVESDLKIPHPQMLARQFVLIPLAEIAPDLVLPDGRTATEAADVGCSRVRRVSG